MAPAAVNSLAGQHRQTFSRASWCREDLGCMASTVELIKHLRVDVCRPCFALSMIFAGCPFSRQRRGGNQTTLFLLPQRGIFSMANFRARRAHAFKQQHGRCCYCQHAMWLTDVATFVRQHGFTLRQAMRFRCTAEHLVARCEGGRNVQENIVAACWWCNTRRHRCKHPLSPAAFQMYVTKRVHAGQWHGKRSSAPS